MTVEQSILNAVRALRPEMQAEVLRIAESLAQSEEPKAPRKPGRGLWKHLSVSITPADIEEARNEMWGSFPRADL